MMRVTNRDQGKLLYTRPFRSIFYFYPALSFFHVFHLFSLSTLFLSHLPISFTSLHFAPSFFLSFLSLFISLPSSLSLLNPPQHLRIGKLLIRPCKTRLFCISVPSQLIRLVSDRVGRRGRLEVVEIIDGQMARL